MREHRCVGPHSFPGLSILIQYTGLKKNPKPRKLTTLPHNSHIVFHEQNAAQLAICDGISGKGNTKCRGSSTMTTGVRGSAKFTLTALTPGAKINISKVRWEECVRAARFKCPTGSLSGTCLGGATSGNVGFRLESTMYELPE